MQAIQDKPLQTEIIEYTLARGATIQDKTNGLARVVFSESETLQHGQSCYNVYVRNKKVLYPTLGNLIFGSSVLIKLKLKNDLIKITEIDSEQTKTVMYANTKKCPGFSIYRNNKTGPAEEFVICSNYIPRELTLAEASQKVQNLPKSPEFAPILAVYNRYGVAVFGLDKNENKNILYWANPHEEHVKKINFKEMHYDELSIINSLDHHVSIRYLDRANRFLRGVISYTEPKVCFLKLENATFFDL